MYEALDDNEVALQNMMGNRFMGFFETQIVAWKTKLATVRATLDSWIEVQRAWCSLEAILIGSEDIREQLPEDAKRFDTVDADFKEQMADAKATSSPIDACLKDLTTGPGKSADIPAGFSRALCEGEAQCSLPFTSFAVGRGHAVRKLQPPHRPRPQEG